MASGKLYIMTDLEGVAGVINCADWIYSSGRYYETAKKFLTEEVNAAISGFFDGGFEDIVVADGHGEGGINIELLDSRVRLMRGWPTKPYPFGLDESYDALAFVGQHAKSGTAYSHLTHTQGFKYLDISLNDISIGEYGQMAAVAGELNIPVIFAAGEKALAAEADALTTRVITAIVKEGIIPGAGDDLSAEEYEHFHEGAIHLSLKKAEEEIYSKALLSAKTFQRDRSFFRPLIFSSPYRLIIKLRPCQGQPEKYFEREHATSIIDLLNGNTTVRSSM